MADEGPTTAGSIVAKLKADDSDWDLTLDRAMAKARELGRENPNIHVGADTATAMAKLQAVDAATASVGKQQLALAAKTAAATDAVDEAKSRLYAATQRLAIAQARENELSMQGSVAESRQLAVRLASTQARKAASDAAAKLAITEQALVNAAHEEALALGEATAAETASTAAKVKANEANKTAASRMGLIGAAIAVLIPMLAPLATYAVSVSGALAGMGAAGILAILGIKSAMDAGTEQGARYSAGLQVLKGDLSELENTAATGMLQSFDAAIYNIGTHMPELNAEIGAFTGQLGSIGGSLLSGVINLFRILNPLFIAGGQYVERLADGLREGRDPKE